MLLGHADPWAFHPHPDAWLLVAALIVGYRLALSRLGPSRVGPGEPVATRRQRRAFYAGAAFIWIAGDWPIHDLSEKYLLSVHMMQHLLITLVAPPLLMVGTPAWLWRVLLAPRALAQAVRWVARPLPAALLFNTVTVASHWPLVVDKALRSEPIHFSIHVVLFGTAALMWFPVLNRVAGFPMLTYPGRMLYLFLQSVVPTVPASFLTFADGAIYRFYAEAPRVFGMSAVGDQQLAGGLMKIVGGLLLWGVIVVMFFRWYGQSDGRPGQTLMWEDVERELERTRPVA